MSLPFFDKNYLKQEFDRLNTTTSQPLANSECDKTRRIKTQPQLNAQPNTKTQAETQTQKHTRTRQAI